MSTRFRNRNALTISARRQKAQAIQRHLKARTDNPTQRRCRKERVRLDHCLVNIRESMTTNTIRLDKYRRHRQAYRRYAHCDKKLHMMSSVLPPD